MASETGHAKNVANFEKLISIVQSIGAAYNPPRANLKLPALTPLPSAIGNRVEEVNRLAAIKIAAVKQREAAFEDLSKLVTRVIAAFEITDADALIGDRARTLARKLKGGRAGERIPDDPATADVDESAQNISVSQMSFDNQLANFDALIGLLESQAAYAPNEEPLKVATLRARVDDMRTKNAAVLSAETALEAVRINRDHKLYREDTGLVALAADVKKYVESVFGADSPQYAQIKDLKFTTPR